LPAIQLIDSIGRLYHVFFLGKLGQFLTISVARLQLVPNGSAEVSAHLYTSLTGAIVRGSANSLSAKRLQMRLRGGRRNKLLLGSPASIGRRRPPFGAHTITLKLCFAAFGTLCVCFVSAH